MNVHRTTATGLRPRTLVLLGQLLLRGHPSYSARAGLMHSK